jgi:divalent metal cation (Fe/Co/Zn/Cd) transporter
MGMTSLRDLSDAPASKEETESLKATVAAIKGIESVKELRARQSGPFLFVECTICIAGHLSASTAHRYLALYDGKKS